MSIRKQIKLAQWQARSEKEQVHFPSRPPASYLQEAASAWLRDTLAEKNGWNFSGDRAAAALEAQKYGTGIGPYIFMRGWMSRQKPMLFPQARNSD